MMVVGPRLPGIMIGTLAPLALSLVLTVSPVHAGHVDTLAPSDTDRAASGASCDSATSSGGCPGAAGTLRERPHQGTHPPQEKPETRRKPGAGEQVRRYVDEHAPRLADWLFDSPADTYENEPLRNRGLRSLPPVAGARRAANDVTILEDMGVAIAESEAGVVYVVSLVASAAGAPLDVRPDDVLVSLNGHPADTPLGFRTRYGRLRQGQPVEVVLRRGEQRVVVTFYKPVDEVHPERGRPGADRRPSILPD